MRAWALVGATCVALGCRPRSSSTPAEAVAAPAVDHGEPLPYHGTWVGPELTFAGPWVLVRPTVADPGVVL
ncbi:hypothetical protein ENSA5_01260 [Enhygromyxa salina]|uniref:Uncharacterized protein n=1 Tax=Enhygromyxa salina TaxID=215803 RepID=A0A2S9YL94_9BACT|nr:hypothetical protein [Enhygromyxa salina]PRQ05806.1 hypothetical protein ENSA5_01260 [Enhygromyxa salina]